MKTTQKYADSPHYEKKKRRPKEDILDVVKQFINYFEAADRSDKK